MRCFECGKKVRRGMSYCGYCDLPIAENPVTRPTRQRPVIPGRPPMAVAAGVLVACLVLLGAGGFVAYRMMGGPSPTASARLGAGQPGLAAAVLAPASASTTITEPSTTTTVAQTTSTIAPSGTSAVTTPAMGVFMVAADTLAATLNDCSTRLVELNYTITSTAPYVPQTVVDELNQMLTDLRAERSDLTRVKPPAAYAAAKNSLGQAGLYMTQTAQYTLTGISAMQRTGRATSANSSFAKATTTAKKFDSAFATYQQSIVGH